MSDPYRKADPTCRERFLSWIQSLLNRTDLMPTLFGMPFEVNHVKPCENYRNIIRTHYLALSPEDQERYEQVYIEAYLKCWNGIEDYDEIRYTPDKTSHHIYGGIKIA